MSESKSTILNPLSGRQIQIGGKTHKKVLRMITNSLDNDLQYGGAVKNNAKKSDDFFEKLLSKTQKVDKQGQIIKGKLPKSKYHLISSELPPNPDQHSWYHHHAPFSQNFGDYVCLKKSTLKELGTFLKDSML